MADPNQPDPGDFRHRLVYQTWATGLDACNQPVATWVTIGTYWAKVEPIVGMELMNARQLKPTTAHKVTMRNVGSAFSGQVQPSGRFLFEATGRILGIDQVFRVGERNAYLSIHCSEQINPP